MPFNRLKSLQSFYEPRSNSLPCGEGLGVGVLVISRGMSPSIPSIFESGMRWPFGSLRFA